MDKLNMAAVFVASIMPIFFGFIYYHPGTLGNVWMRANGFTPESLKGGPKPILFLGVYVMSLMLSLWCGLQFMDVHQTSLDFNDSHTTGRPGTMAWHMDLPTPSFMYCRLWVSMPSLSGAVFPMYWYISATGSLRFVR